MARVKQGQSAYDAALDYLTPKDRTQREVENYLDERNYSEIEVINTIERLKANGLIDDERYAKRFVETRLNTKPISRQKLRQQLEAHFIAPETISSALAYVSDEMEGSNALAIAKKFYRQFSGLEECERLRRVELRLSSRGYSYDCIKEAIKTLNLLNDDED